jgi:dihydrodipicolinate synthase/N-acetylneuraminate lyase
VWTAAVTPAELAATVVAVPPLPLDAGRAIVAAEVRRLVARVEAGGVRTILWGGNAQLQHWPVSRYAELLEMAEATAAPGTLVVPSLGPDWGRLVDQAAILARSRFPTAMALPMPAHTTPAGVALALAEAAERAGRPLVAYIRQRGYLDPDGLSRLVETGAVLAVKYGVPMPERGRDAYLDALVAAIGSERILSGSGELLAVPHLLEHGLAGFTSGCVCLAPRLSGRVLEALKRADRAALDRLLPPIRALESLRERFGLVRVLHDAVRLAGLALTGPILPMLSTCEPALEPEIAAAARALVAAEAGLEPHDRAA